MLHLRRWLPPLQTSAHEATVQTAAQRGGILKDRDRPLSDVQRDRFEDMLRKLTQERSDVAEAMIFALDHAECATEVSCHADLRVQQQMEKLGQPAVWVCMLHHAMRADQKAAEAMI